MLRSDARINPPDVFRRYETRIAELREDTRVPDGELLDQVRKMWADQEARLSSIDSRAGQLMAAAGIAASLTTTAVGQKGILAFGTGKPLLVVTYLLALGYFAYCIIVALRVHGRRRRYKIGPDELLPPPVTEASPAVSYTRHLALELLDSLVKNYRSDNRQVEALHMAQWAFRNAVILLVLGGIATIWS
ncbi:hypothetical protein [Amycolatopsis sp. WQ 127309]|uniref:hypothetical protein n=1 Tax=Amycolatopsis sp. WQ 127309 TaxID=2932773 RepID=UPI001FF4EC98|nr:hypothetical protein [Amycolatopsis sp. WQ 127309]UOZ07586.1 hypothetical protein MUY22_04630 [Amycolatopsis sp. WQ 127309]